MVDFEDAEVWVWVAEGEGVEARSEKDILVYVSAYGSGESVLGVAAANDNKGAEGDGVRARLAAWFGLRGAVKFVRLGTEDAKGERVVEDAWRDVDELVGGSAECDPKSSARWLGGVQTQIPFGMTIRKTKCQSERMMEAAMLSTGTVLRSGASRAGS